MPSFEKHPHNSVSRIHLSSIVLSSVHNILPRSSTRIRLPLRNTVTLKYVPQHLLLRFFATCSFALTLVTPFPQNWPSHLHPNCVVGEETSQNRSLQSLYLSTAAKDFVGSCSSRLSCGEEMRMSCYCGVTVCLDPCADSRLDPRTRVMG